MSLKNQIKSAVDTVFNSLGDLVEDIILDNTESISSDNGFNFGPCLDPDTGDPIETTCTTYNGTTRYVTKGYLSTRKSYENNFLITSTTVTIKNDPNIEFDFYSKLIVRGKEYKCNKLSENDFIVVFTIKEA